MAGQNICKFSEIRSSDLICTNFIYETASKQAVDTRLEQNLLGVVAEGKGVLIQGGQEYELMPGDIFYIRRGVCFRIIFEDGGSYLYISFQGRRAVEIMKRATLNEDAGVFDCRGERDRLVAFGMECLDKADGGNLDIFGEAMLLYLFGHITVSKKQGDRLLSDIITLSGDHFTEVGFSLGKLSEMLGYAPKYLSFYFKKKRGIGYAEYLREMRLDHAVFLIEEGVECVKNIAMLSGFSDALYFSRVFKKSKGISPSEYVKKYASERDITQKEHE